MWRHDIHSFLVLLRHLLPDSLDQTLTFLLFCVFDNGALVQLAPNPEETWIECLGDLARYRMAMEESDLRDR